MDVHVVNIGKDGLDLVNFGNTDEHVAIDTQVDPINHLTLCMQICILLLNFIAMDGLFITTLQSIV